MKPIFTRLLLLLLSCSLFLSQTQAAVPLPAPVSGEPDPATVNAAVKAFNSLPAKERRTRIRAVKAALKEFKAERRAGREPIGSKALQVIVTILIPPLGVYLHEGAINTRFWISLVLTLLFYIPGLIYSLIVVLGS